jgi:hypothetical protein
VFKKAFSWFMRWPTPSGIDETIYCDGDTFYEITVFPGKAMKVEKCDCKKVTEALGERGYDRLFFKPLFSGLSGFVNRRSPYWADTYFASKTINNRLVYLGTEVVEGEEQEVFEMPGFWRTWFGKRDGIIRKQVTPDPSLTTVETVQLDYNPSIDESFFRPPEEVRKAAVDKTAELIEAWKEWADQQERGPPK